MIEPDRVLRPLREAERAIERLETYESPAELTEALRATWHAAERTLRTLLRSDATAPDSVRMTAMSPDQMAVDAVMTELRRRDLVSLGLAGRMHELRHALERADAGGVRASDADNARDVVRCIIEEVHGLAARASKSSAGPIEIESSARSPSDREDDDSSVVRPRSALNLPVRPLVFIAVTGVLLVAAAIAVSLVRGASSMERGITAFQDDSLDRAEEHFRAALQEDDANNTARLYLARILRMRDQHDEAAQLLRTAVDRAPEDPAVRRELGYLFLDLESPRPAADQFRRAVEMDPDEALNWTGLVRALRESGDSAAAAEWLQRAPREVREMVGLR